MHRIQIVLNPGSTFKPPVMVAGRILPLNEFLCTAPMTFQSAKELSIRLAAKHVIITEQQYLEHRRAWVRQNPGLLETRIAELKAELAELEVIAETVATPKVARQLAPFDAIDPEDPEAREAIEAVAGQRWHIGLARHYRRLADLAGLVPEDDFDNFRSLREVVDRWIVGLPDSEPVTEILDVEYA